MKSSTFEYIVYRWFVTFLICVILWMASLLAFGQEVETFKEFHVPAKQTLDAGWQGWLGDGLIVGNKTVSMNPHMTFLGTDFFYNILPLSVVGAQPPLIHEQSIRPVNGYLPFLWIFFDHPVTSVSFDAFPDADVGYLTIALVTDPHDLSGPHQAANGLGRGFSRVNCAADAPIYAVVLYWVNWFIDGSGGSFSNFQIQ